MYKEVYNMDITLLRWMNAAGARQHLRPVRKFIPLAICKALLNQDLEIYGTGEQTIDIIDVRDIAEIAIKSTRSGLGKEEEVFDVGSGIPLTCNKVAELIIKKTQSKSKIKYLKMRTGEALDTKIVAKSHNKLFNKINYALQFSYEDTIDECINYYTSLGIKELEKANNFFK